MSLIKSKIQAMLLHGVVTLGVALLGAFLVFGIWYPNGIAKFMAGAQLYLLILLVEICLGPLMSLVIYNPAKPRSELIRDYSIIAIIQLFALLYGLHSTFISRPVFSVFVIDRLEIISAVELTEESLLTAKEKKFKQLPFWGMEQICVERPTDRQERSDILVSAVAGKDIEMMPKYYRDCRSSEVQQATLNDRALLDLLKEKNNMEQLEQVKQLQPFSWLPVKSRFGAWVAIYPKQQETNIPVYIDIDPFIY